ncbi:MAG: hypothetical protein KC983_03115, partial [Phycisphaerales bacterium]|nr:hypothetical protein [Phycisphaerales bacterium]
MGTIFLILGVVAAFLIMGTAIKLPNAALRAAAGVCAVVVLLVGVVLSSARFISQDEAGIVIKNVGSDIPQGGIIAVNGEKGPQAEILGPGLHLFYWPGLYTVDEVRLVEIGPDEVGLLTAVDGLPLPAGQAFAPEWETDRYRDMLNAEYFLGEGKGHKGPQASVLTPGSYRLNTTLFNIEKVRVTNVDAGTVGVVKSNVGLPPEGVPVGHDTVVEKNQRGIWRDPYPPQKLYLNTKAYEITSVSTKEQTVRYGAGGDVDYQEIEVRTSDGFTFPVDVRIEYQITPEDAPNVVARFGGDGESLRSRLTSAVRDIFRNNAENVKALDYVQQRSTQGQTSSRMLQERMHPLGIMIKAVAIGDIGNEETLGNLLKTQKDREIAIQEQLTIQEQQKAAERRKELMKTEQEAMEERRLATAAYEVKIADEEKAKRITEAEAEAESIRIRAEAQAEAYRVVAEQIGPRNAAMLELLKIVGDAGINITPRVMVVGDTGGSSNGAAAAKEAETAALIGTMLDRMVEDK